MGIAGGFEGVLSLVGCKGVCGGRWQRLVLLLTTSQCALAFLHFNSFLALQGEPDHWCTGGDPGANSSRCYLDLEECQNWEFDQSFFMETVVSEWSLVCSRTALRPIMENFNIAGLSLGSFLFGLFSDRYGRKSASTAALLLWGVSAVSLSFAPTYYAYLPLRLLSGFGHGGAFTCSYTLMLESVSTSQRPLWSSLYGLGNAVGTLGLALVVFQLRRWRPLQLVISAPLLVMAFLYWFLLPESPRWLLARGKLNQATSVLFKASQVNHVDPPLDKTELKSLLEGTYSDSNPAGGQSWSLVTWAPLRSRTLRMSFCFIAIFFFTYGVGYLASKDKGDVISILVLTGMSQLATLSTSWWTLERFGRKWTLSGVCALGGIATIIGSWEFGGWWMSQVLLFLAIFASNTSILSSVVMTSELFPTQLRNVAIGFLLLIGRFGAIAATFAVDLMAREYPQLCTIVFGVSFIASCVVCSTLPDTRTLKIPDTVQGMKDEHQKAKDLQGKADMCITHM